MGEIAQTDIVIFGAGGHAKVVIETCLGTRYRPVVCLGGSRWTQLLGVPVASEGEAAAWLAKGVRHGFVAIGSNSVRERVAASARALGFDLVTIVSPHSYVSPTAMLGPGCVVMVGAAVQVEADVGELGIVNTGASIDHECKLGRAVHIAPHATLCGNVVAGDRVWFGAGSTVIEGVVLADDVFVAAGAAVTRNVAVPGLRVGGAPARPLGPT
jgi:UDP-perosamine 4-acetyltransferase